MQIPQIALRRLGMYRKDAGLAFSGHVLSSASMDDLLSRMSSIRPTLCPVAAGETVVVGVSGGADSLCLLHLLHRLAPEWGCGCTSPT